MGKMKSNQGGFTLIELVVVIVILGILAATALPKFIDMSSEAGQAAAQGVAGAISSAGSVNYAKYKAGGNGAVVINDKTDACASILSNASSLLTGSVKLVSGNPADSNEYKFAKGASGGACTAEGTVVECTITSQGGQTAVAYVPCTGVAP